MKIPRPRDTATTTPKKWSTSDVFGLRSRVIQSATSIVARINSLEGLLSRRECSVSLGVCPFLDWLLSTEDCLGKKRHLRCSKLIYAVVNIKLGLDLVVLGDRVVFSAKWFPSISTVAFAKADAVDNHPRLELVRAPYAQTHKFSFRTITQQQLQSPEPTPPAWPPPAPGEIKNLYSVNTEKLRGGKGCRNGLVVKLDYESHLSCSVGASYAQRIDLWARAGVDTG